MNARDLCRHLGRTVWREWIRPLALPLLLVACAKSAIADINYIPSGSMQPTILEGDVVFINKLAYALRVPFTTARLGSWSEPTRGDIVVCLSPDDGTRLVKRVVGLPGDTIELHNDVLIVNGHPCTYAALAPELTTDLPAAQREVALFARESLEDRRHAMMVLPHVPALRNFGPYRVPEDGYFVLGDNRDNSRDSRYFGPVRRRDIMGEATGVFVSADVQRWLQPRLRRFFSGLD